MCGRIEELAEQLYKELGALVSKKMTIHVAQRDSNFVLWIDELDIEIEASTLRQCFVKLGNLLKRIPKKKYLEFWERDDYEIQGYEGEM